MKLCLGTAQFGLDYGINNPHGKISQENILEILTLAHDNGIVMLDTASAYGNSESVLGESILQTGQDFQIITKYPVNTDVRPVQWIDTSLKQLRKDKIYGYLFHNYSIYQKHPDYINDFTRIKEAGKSEKTGFSLYFPYEAEYILRNNIPCDIVQIPYNIFDQRFAPILPELKSRGIEIHVRSIFLQGLFFIDPEKLDIHFNSIKSLLIELHQTAENNSISITALCLAFAYNNQEISYIVVGIDSLDNLKDIIGVYSLLGKLYFYNDFFAKFTINDEKIILPFNWQT